MKNKSNGGRHAFVLTMLRLKKFSVHLNLLVEPFIFETAEINFNTLLMVNQHGQLKAIQKAKLN